MNTGISFAADRSLSAFSPTHRTELWLPLLRKTREPCVPTRAARHPACGQTDAEFSELRFGRHFFAAEIRCALPNSADGLVICEGQHQLRHVVLWKARIILDADVTGTWRALGSELQRSEEAIPKSEEQSEVDISLSSPVDVVKPVHSTYRQELLKLAKLVVGIGVLYEELHGDCESEQNGDIDRQAG